MDLNLRVDRTMFTDNADPIEVQGARGALLKRKDSAWCDTPEGEVGPLRRVLRSYNGLVGLSFGHMGEASKSVDQLLRTVARTTAEGAARLRMTRSMETATGMVVSRLRRQWGMAAWAARCCSLGEGAWRQGRSRGRTPTGDTGTPEHRQGAVMRQESTGAQGGKTNATARRKTAVGWAAKAPRAD